MKSFEETNLVFVPAQSSRLIPAIICDIDGTIALRGDRDPFDHSVAMEDAVNRPVEDVLYKFKDTHAILYVSGRDEKFRDITEYWLWVHKLDFHSKLLMRSLDDTRPDSDVKEEIWRWNIDGVYDVLFVLDDRQRVVDRWRQLGLTVLQVAEGNY